MTLRTVAYVADALGRSERTVRDQLAKGALAGRKVGRDWLVDDVEIDRYRRENLGKTGPKGPRSTPGKRARK